MLFVRKALLKSGRMNIYLSENAAWFSDNNNLISRLLLILSPPINRGRKSGEMSCHV